MGKKYCFSRYGNNTKIAEIFGVSVEELMNAKSIPGNRRKGTPYLLNVILKAVPTAMGIAVGCKFFIRRT